NISGEQLEILVQPFGVAIERATLLWGDVAFQRWDGQRWRQQALAGMFDAEMIAGSLLSDKQIKSAAAKRTDVVEATKRLFADSDFEKAVRMGQKPPFRIKLRKEKSRDMLLSVVGGLEVSIARGEFWRNLSGISKAIALEPLAQGATNTTISPGMFVLRR